MKLLVKQQIGDKCRKGIKNMDEKIDLRVIKTQQAIKMAVISLIEEKGMDAVTVKDITQKAQINRGTFYAHYQDKFDCLEKWENEIIHGIQQIAETNALTIQQALNSQAAFPETFNLAILMLEYIDQHHDFMRVMLGKNGNLAFQTKLKQIIWEALLQHVIIDDTQFRIPKKYFIAYVASAHVGVIQQWLNQKERESPVTIAHIIAMMTENGPLEAITFKSLHSKKP